MNAAASPSARPLPRSNLRTLTIGVLLLAFVAFALLQWISARWLYDGGFQAAERRDALSRGRHAQALLRSRADIARRVAFDDGTWEEAYLYMLGRNPGHPHDEFGAMSYKSLRIDGFAYVRPDGTIADLERFDTGVSDYVPTDPSWRLAVERGGPIGARLDMNRDVDGFALVGGALHAWGAAPIVHSNGKGPPVGVLVVLTPLDDAFLESATRTVDSSVRLRDRPLHDGPVDSQLPLEYGDARFIEHGERLLETRFPMGQVSADGVLEVTVSGPRVVYQAALKSSRYFLWSTLAFGTLLIALALWFVDRRLLRPVQSASRELVAIGRTADLSRRLAPAPRNDQIGDLVGAANEMLASLEGARGAEAARDAALSASRMKSEFLARMSHEIRTPMNGVLGMSELMQTTSLTDRQRRFLDIIHRSAESLLGVINDILDFSKVEAGRLELQVAEFSPGQTLDETVELLAPSAHRKGLELAVQVDPAVPGLLVGDASRLRQILTNLIGNAIKFTERGRVGVRMSASAAGAGAVQIECTVADTGIGISPQALAGIFESFSQADTTVTRRFGGTGLGLPIARHLARLMGGDIHVASEAGAGSAFTVTAVFGAAGSPAGAGPLAARAAAPAAAAPILAGESASRLSMLVLLAEDNPVNREVGFEMLSALGCRVLLAENGREAVAVWEASQPDAVLMDVQMPDVDGMEAARRIRRLEAQAGLRAVPIIAVTAHAMDRNRDDCLRAGMNGFLSKPYSKAQLSQALEACRSG